MNGIKCFLVAWLCLVASAPYAQIGVDRPTIGDYVRRDAERVLDAWQNGVRSTAEFNASIRAARKEFKETVGDPKRHAEAEKKFADLLFAKDVYYATQFLFEGVSDTSRKMSKAMEQLFLSSVDGGIPEDGRAAFEEWVVGLRKSMGATGNEMLFTNEANMRKAFSENESLYLQYKVLRDQQENNGGISQRMMAQQARLEKARKAVEEAVHADGSAKLFKQSIGSLDVDAWRSDLETHELREALFEASRGGQQALRCVYGPLFNASGDEAFGRYEFWYKAPPSTLAKLKSMDIKGAIRALGDEGLQECPVSEKEASILWDRFMVVGQELEKKQLLSMLPSTVQLAQLLVGTQGVSAEVANTDETREVGLAHRKSLPANHGMLFVFDKVSRLCFWMKNTPLPLSIAFISAQGRVVNIVDMRPLSLDQRCSEMPISYALAMTKGWFQKNQVKRGTKVENLPKP